MSLGFLVILIISVFLKKNSHIIVGYLSLILIFLTQFFVLKDIFLFEEIFNSFFVIDSFGSFLKSIILISAGLVIYFYLIVKNEISLQRPEFLLITLIAIIGMMLMVSSNDLLSLFVSLELQSLALYILVSFSKDDFNSSEAGVKYFVIGSLSTCIFLFGSSLIYGIIGSTNFSEISQFISDQYNLPTLLIIGLIFILVSLSLKISAAPFHMWTPDVYQGAPSIVTAFLSTAPKIAVFAVLIRLLVYPFGEIIIDWGKIIIILSIASMIIGSLGALKQDDLKRLMAYSTINHIGFILMALVPGSEDGITAICIYLIFYLTMNLGVFLFILNMRRDQINVTKIKDLSGLYKTEPVIAGCLAIIFFSMAGIPPLAGFIGKLLVLNIVIDNNLFFLAIIAVVTSVIAAFYYIRLIKSMFFDSPTDELDLLTNPQSKLLMTLLSFFNLTVILYPQFFLNLCASITLSLFALK
ncbi:MAG: NADH-quinone oxidoreductase subunit N [alpha proteobacterium MED-G10]|nr:MAG: NADH-quinone oxidoreductase subunit N [alpha proteobacterium MED-G10]|tara:strand:+ start:2454 stop:3857 length:1404 start_codon:yes stop_codon:yes gene_type:complete